MTTPAWTLTEARRWCRQWAGTHYENFRVVSLALPRQKREEYAALYAFARGADDLADEDDTTRQKVLQPVRNERPSRFSQRSGGRHETIEPEPSRRKAGTAVLAGKKNSNHLTALRRWRDMLEQTMHDEPPDHPAFLALHEVIRRHRIEPDGFHRMLDAFERDQLRSRYETALELGEYMKGSAEPVGRWVLRLYGLREERLDRWSDAVCRGLQIANFLQDIVPDLEVRDRIYLPRKDLERFGVSETDLLLQPSPPPVRRLVAHQAAWADRELAQGGRLLRAVPKPLGRQLYLFIQGGYEVLRSLKRIHYDIASGHLTVPKHRKLALLAGVLLGVRP
ncbi:hypothetical protein GF324_12910 [bacterium]|nr:hypothetical protein [bacterium]